MLWFPVFVFIRYLQSSSRQHMMCSVLMKNGVKLDSPRQNWILGHKLSLVHPFKGSPHELPNSQRNIYHKIHQKNACFKLLYASPHSHQEGILSLWRVTMIPSIGVNPWLEPTTTSQERIGIIRIPYLNRTRWNEKQSAISQAPAVYIYVPRRNVGILPSLLDGWNAFQSAHINRRTGFKCVRN